MTANELPEWDEKNMPEYPDEIIDIMDEVECILLPLRRRIVELEARIETLEQERLERWAKS